MDARRNINQRKSHNMKVGMCMPHFARLMGIGNSESGSMAQGAFKYCLGGAIGCIQHKYPWIDMTVYGDGSYSSSTGM